jgi:hypothetical protein
MNTYTTESQYTINNCPNPLPNPNDEPYEKRILSDLEYAGSWFAKLANLLIGISRIFIPFALAIGLVYYFSRKITVGSVLLIILLTIMINIFIQNMNGNNLPGSLPSATYPIPPHLGNDGISLVNRSI